MAFPTDLTAVLTGTSRDRLRHWHSTGLFSPEIATEPRLLYSFRDVVALRTVVRLRASTSLQNIRRAFENMSALDLTEHPSRYRFGTDGKTIGLIDEAGNAVDLVGKPGQYEVLSLAEMFGAFENRRGEQVVDFLRPRSHLEVRAGRLGGRPTIADTRIGYDTVASLVSGGDVSLERVAYFHPGVSAAAARDAVDFDRLVRDSA